jgi:hypothetical protein
MLSEMIGEFVRAFFLSQDRLATHVRPDRLFPYAPLNELLVVFPGLSPLSDELSQDPVSGKAGMGSLPSDRCPITALFPGLRRLSPLCTDRI